MEKYDFAEINHEYLRLHTSNYLCVPFCLCGTPSRPNLRDILEQNKNRENSENWRKISFQLTQGKTASLI
jgi:hypothetical protein